MKKEEIAKMTKNEKVWVTIAVVILGIIFIVPIIIGLGIIQFFKIFNKENK